MAESKRVFLVIDAGGTSTRAVIVDSSGRCLGYGRAGGGNPTSAGITSAVAAVGLAAEQARAGSDITGRPPHLVVIALAGENTAAFREQVSARLAPLGFGPVIVEPDLLGMFHSGTHHRDGYVLVAGTVAVAARVLDRSSGCTSGGRSARRSRSGNGLDRTRTEDRIHQRRSRFSRRPRTSPEAAGFDPLLVAAGAIVGVRAAGVPSSRGSGGT